MRNYLFVTYMVDGKKREQRFTMSETKLINTVVKEADDGLCTVSLETVEQKVYDLYFK